MRNTYTVSGSFNVVKQMLSGFPYSVPRSGCSHYQRKTTVHHLLSESMYRPVGNVLSWPGTDLTVFNSPSYVYKRPIVSAYLLRIVNPLEVSPLSLLFPLYNEFHGQSCVVW